MQQNDEILPNSSNYLFKRTIRGITTSDQLANFEHFQSDSLVAVIPQLSRRN